ncbi:MAG: DMT family transporter [Weeksellaceae bacterium]
MSPSTRYAPVFIMIAASLWAIDAIFRTQLTYTIPPSSIVLFEHTLGFLFLSPIFFKYLDVYKKMSAKVWVNFLVMTVCSSVLGGLLFTAALQQSFAFNDFVTPLLLQKLQPLFVVGLSMILLKEKVTLRFLILAALALVGSYMITFGTEVVSLALKGKEMIYLMSIGATFCWGAGTIMSKYGLSKIPFPAATALRFLLAIPVALIFALALGQTYSPMALGFNEIWRFFVIAGITGAAGVYLYYKGLQHTDARVSTFAELMLPLVSIIIATTALNPYGAAQQLSVANIVGIVIMLTSIVLISFDAANATVKEPVVKK